MLIYFIFCLSTIEGKLYEEGISVCFVQFVSQTPGRVPSTVEWINCFASNSNRSECAITCSLPGIMEWEANQNYIKNTELTETFWLGRGC